MTSRIVAGLFTVALVTGCASNGGMTGGTSGSALPQTAERSIDTQSAQTRVATYTVTNLGTFGGNVSSAASINEVGWITGSANHAGDQSGEAALWRDGKKIPLGTLGGENSGVNWPNHNNFGLIAGISETPRVNPLNEDWSCQAFFPTAPDTKHICLGFAWRDGTMKALSTLGGFNGYASGTNDLGQIVGWAETASHDPTCSAFTHFPNSFYQVLQFEPVVWNVNGRIRELPTVSGDPDGAATAINDTGDIVGISGTCDQAVGRFSAKHAVLWQNFRAIDIGSFGGISWNTPQAINNRGVVVGFLNLPGDTQGQFQPVGFIWTKTDGLRKILPLPGDTNSVANGINDLGQVVGQSFNAKTGAARAFIWENGKTMDLNCFLPANSSLYLLSANDIDDRGNIVGQALVQGTSQVPAFIARPPQNWDPATAAPARPMVTSPIIPASIRLQLNYQRKIGGS